jgi:hypothetical protein
MASKILFVVVMLLSMFLGVDAKRSARKTEKLYRKSGKWQRKLRGVWVLLGVKPFMIEPGKVGEKCVLKSKLAEDYVRKSTVSTDYVRKSEVQCAGVVVEGDVVVVVGGGGEKESLSPRKTAKLYRKAGKYQRKLRSAWALLGVRPTLVQPGEEGDECVLKSKVDEDYALKSAVDAAYVLKARPRCGCNDADSCKVIIESSMEGSAAIAAIDEALNENDMDVVIKDGIDFGFTDSTPSNDYVYVTGIIVPERGIIVPEGRTLHLNGDVSASGITININNGGTVINHGGALTIGAAQHHADLIDFTTLRFTGSLNIQGGGILTNDGGTIINPVFGIIDNDGTIINDDGEIDNHGTIVNHYGSINNDGTITSGITSDGWGMIYNYAAINNRGTITINDGIENRGTITNDGGTITIDFGTMHNFGTIINNDGTFTNDGYIIGYKPPYPSGPPGVWR